MAGPPRRCRPLALCASVAIILLSLSPAVRSQSATLSVTGVGEVSVGVSKGFNGNAVQMRCPDVRDPATGFFVSDPNCKLPAASLARGNAAVERFQAEYGVKTGDKVEVTFDVRTRAGSSGDARGRRLAQSSGDAAAAVTATATLRPGSIKVVSSDNTQKEVYRGSPIAVRAVIYLLDYCGWTSPLRSAKEAAKFLFDGQDSVEATVQSQYRTCSYGKVSFNPENVAVVGPIQINCTGSLTTFGLNTAVVDGTKGCDSFWRTWVSQSARAQAQKLAESDPKLKALLQNPGGLRSLFYMPSGAPCGWPLFSIMGCSATGPCDSFVLDTSAPYATFRSLQHNMGLTEAIAAASGSSRDLSDPMGNTPADAAGLQCHNAYNNWRLGWAGPVAGGDLHAGSFTPSANRKTLTIPASSASDKHMVIVNLGAMSPTTGMVPAGYDRWFITYRARNATYRGYDSGLSRNFDRKVQINNYDFSFVDGPMPSAYYGYLEGVGPKFAGSADPAVWTSKFVPFSAATGLGGGLRVRVLATGPASATVEVCRMYAQTEGAPGSADCNANQDRDCDGFIGNSDPDCVRK